MQKVIKLKLAQIKYTGDSIGNDIRIEVKIGDRSFNYETKIKPGTTANINHEIGQIETQTEQETFESPIEVKVIEKDIIFDDVGRVNDKIIIHLAETNPQNYPYQVKVQELQVTLRKATAVFDVLLQIQVAAQNTVSKLRPYNPGSLGEDYNIYDNQIDEMVKYWNGIFLAQTDPPPIPLDPNLIKAMMYVESKIGWYRPKTGYSGYPDVMQVADSRNDAIYALKNSYNPKYKKQATEYEVINGQLETLEYPEANGDKDYDSIKWGIRYLYHRAQTNINKNNSWTRGWIDWKEAVKLYNSRPTYQAEVYQVYEQGKGYRGYKLWMIPLLMIIGAGSFFASASLEHGRVAGINTEPKFYAYRQTISDRNQALYAFYVVNKVSGERFAFNMYPYDFPVNFFDETLSVENVSMASRPEETWLLIRGTGTGSHEFSSLVVYDKHGFDQVYKCDQDTLDKGFNAQVIFVDDFDNDGDVEVVESTVFPDPTINNQFEVHQILYKLSTPRCFSPTKKAISGIPSFEYAQVLPELDFR